MLLVLAACTLDERYLLQNWDAGTSDFLAPDVQDLDLVDEPPVLDGRTFRGEVGPGDIGGGRPSGATFSFTGTGERICLIVDPQSVFRDDLTRNPDGGEGPDPFFEDFPHDDGDIDLLAGQAAFYTGTPGEEMGDFVAGFIDDNGVERRIDLNLCLMTDYFGQAGGHAGRASPEWCSFMTTTDVLYRVVLQVYSVPMDDNRLRFALELRSGECPATVDECTLRGDADRAEDGVLPQGEEDVEQHYCQDYDPED
jgi:hypothetical protein